MKQKNQARRRLKVCHLLEIYKINLLSGQIYGQDTTIINNFYLSKIIITTFNMQTNKIPKSLNQLIFLDTKDFLQHLHNQYKPHFNNYSRIVYNKLISCYDQHLTPQAQQTLNSNAMLEYYSCYKAVLRQAKLVNKKLHDQGLANERKLKKCIQIRSNFSKSNFEFEGRHQECVEKYRQTYENLYSTVFKQFVPNVVKQP